MRLREFSIDVALILTLAAAPAFAAGPKVTAPRTGGPKTTAPAPKSITGSPKTTTTTHGAPKTTTTTHGSPKTTVTHGSPKTTASTSTHGSPKTTTTIKTHGSPKKSTTTTSTTTASATGTTTTSTSTGSTTTSGTSTSTTTTTTTEQLNPIAQKISTNKGLSSKMATLLPAKMTLNEASRGFKNQGQFIAALHVSQNLGIPFADLKEAMTGIRPVTTSTKTGGSTTTTTGNTTTTGGTTASTTTSEPTKLLSLGQAIKKLRPSADSATAESTATTQATSDLSSK